MSVIMCGGIVRHRWFNTDCPFCGIKDSVIIRALSYSAYWGSRQTCTNCGDSWADGELLERPFRRGWRAKSIARAQQAMDDACDHPVRWDPDDHHLLPCPCTT